MASTKVLLFFITFLGFVWHKEAHGQILLSSGGKKQLRQKIDSMTARCTNKIQVIPPINAEGIDKCIDEFNALGLQLEPEIDVLRDRYFELAQQYWESENFNRSEADEELQERRNDWTLASFRAECEQIAKGISCLLELQKYFISCGDEEGITLPFIGKAICTEDEHTLPKKFTLANEEDAKCLQKTDSIQTFQQDFHECTVENGYSLLDETGVITNTCSLSTRVYECYKKAFQKNCPGIDSKSLEIADSLISATINLANGQEEMVKEAIKSCLPVPTY